MEDPNKIKFALFLEGWSFEGGNESQLWQKAKKIAPLEFALDMKGSIFCPECCAPLFRSPEDKDYASNGRKAFFAHVRSVQTECSLRVKQSEGKKYVNEEEAKRAVEDGKLVIVKSFMTDKPEPIEVNGPRFYDNEPNEDKQGPVTESPIGRHNGEEFKLPSKITTIRGLCKSFDNNLSRYFLLPGQSAARTLQDQLISVTDVKETCDTPRLYIGRITRSTNMGRHSWNIRQTFLRFPASNGFKDFCLKTTDENSKEHGIDDNSVDRVVIAYGKVAKSGVGLCIENIGWGEFALLPTKYEYLVDHV